MPRYTVTIVEEREYELEIEADSALEANEIALETDPTEALSDSFHAVRLLHEAEES